MQAHQLLKNWNEAEADSARRLRSPSDTAWALPHGAINGTDAKATMESTPIFLTYFLKEVGAVQAGLREMAVWESEQFDQILVDEPDKEFRRDSVGDE